MSFLKQSTAFTFRAGAFLDDTDASAETTLTIAQADIQISKAGGAFAQTSASSPTTTHDSDGFYQCPLTATDTDTVGLLTVQISMTGVLPFYKDFFVLPANVYDSFVGGDLLQVDVEQIDGSADAAERLAQQLDALETGTAQGGGSAYIDLASGTSASDDQFNNHVAFIVAGTGAGQQRLVDDYVHSARRCSISPNWFVNPDATSVYLLVPISPSSTANPPSVTVTSIATAAMEAIADTFLGRAIAGGSNAGRLVKEAFYRLRNRVQNDSGTLRVFEDDDTTESWNGALTTSSSQEPITQVDPS